MWWFLACSAADPVPNERSFALLELFTSQSCSSCPGADRQLDARRAHAEQAHQRVFTVAWHVDTWNGVGWVDPYSDAAYTERQQAYAEVHDSRTYTPQLLVNGVDEMIGKNGPEIDEAVDRWLARPAQASVRLQRGALTERQLFVEVETADAAPDDDLWVLLLQNDIVDDIPSGENAGRTLEHQSVVRAALVTSPQTPQVALPVPAGVAEEDLELVAFLQDPVTLEVHGAGGE